MSSSNFIASSSFASGSASGSVYSYLNGIHKDNIDMEDLKKEWHLNEYELNLKIEKFFLFKIPTIQDESSNNWANFGISIFNLLTSSNYDYPDHWFIIACSENYPESKSSYSGLHWSTLARNPPIWQLIALKKTKPQNRVPTKEQKEGIMNLYYLIEKTEGGKIVKCYFWGYKDIVYDEEENYKRFSTYLSTHYLRCNEKISISDIMKFIKEKTVNYYDLLQANCQDFARFLIDSYCK